MAFVTVALKNLENNPYRDPNAYVWKENAITSLMESIGDLSYWENILIRKTKDGRLQIVYGHHRIEALRRLVAEGLTEYENIKVNVRPETQLTDEIMLKIFVQENKDTWGEDPQNLCMSVLQLQAHLTTLLMASADKDAFMKKVGAQGALRVDDRSFTRMKNHGVGASVIAQFLGDTWSRQTIHDALQVIEKDEATFKLAQNLPNVTLANRFQKLVTKSDKGKGEKRVIEMFDEATQRKVADKIIKGSLTRAEVEDAIKINKTQDESDPVKAIDEVLEKKKAKIKAVKEAAAKDRPAPKEPVEKVLVALERVLDVTRKERVNLKDEDIGHIKEGISLIVEVLDTEPPEIADPVVEETD